MDIEAYSVSTIYSCLLVQGYRVHNVSEIGENTYLVVMKKGVTTKAVLLVPRAGWRCSQTNNSEYGI